MEKKGKSNEETSSTAFPLKIYSRYKSERQLLPRKQDLYKVRSADRISYHETYQLEIKKDGQNEHTDKDKDKNVDNELRVKRRSSYFTKLYSRQTCDKEEPGKEDTSRSDSREISQQKHTDTHPRSRLFTIKTVFLGMCLMKQHKRSEEVLYENDGTASKGNNGREETTKSRGTRRALLLDSRPKEVLP